MMAMGISIHLEAATYNVGCAERMGRPMSRAPPQPLSYSSYGAIHPGGSSGSDVPVVVDCENAAATERGAADGVPPTTFTTHTPHHDIAATASVPSEVVNMTKNLIGGGVLSLSGGVARFANSPLAAMATVEWIVILGAVFGYFSLLIGKSCAMTHSSTYRECWERSVGPRGGLTVAVVTTLDPLVGIFANASVLSQSLQLLLAGVNVNWTVRQCLLFSTAIAILPLCLMRSLNALAPFSAVGMAAVVFTLAVMVVRFLDGSYQPGGVFYDDIDPSRQPSFGIRNRPWSIDALPFVTMAYTAWDMHFNAPRFYAELKDASMPRFRQAVSCSFGITAVIYFSIAVAGFLTFGENSNSYILNNYSPRDPLASVSRAGIGMCALVTYPLNFIGVRDNCLDVLGIADKVDTVAKVNCFTILLLTILTGMSCFLTDLGLIMTVGGGTTVALVDFVFPAFMFRHGIRNFGHGSVNERREVWLVMILMVIGVLFGLIGVWNSVLVKDQ